MSYHGVQPYICTTTKEATHVWKCLKNVKMMLHCQLKAPGRPLLSANWNLGCQGGQLLAPMFWGILTKGVKPILSTHILGHYPIGTAQWLAVTENHSCQLLNHCHTWFWLCKTNNESMSTVQGRWLCCRSSLDQHHRHLYLNMLIMQH